MNWHDILKLKKYGVKDINRIFNNMGSFKDKSSTSSIVIPLFNLMYFNIPLSAKERVEMRRMASYTTNIEISKVLSNLATAGSKIIESDRILPFGKKEMKTERFSIYDTGNLYSRESVTYTIGLIDFDWAGGKLINLHYLNIKDGLYRMDFSKTIPGGSDIDTQWDFIKKISNYFKYRDCNFTVTLETSSFSQNLYNPTYEDVIDWLRDWEDGDYDEGDNELDEEDD